MVVGLGEHAQHSPTEDGLLLLKPTAKMEKLPVDSFIPASAYTPQLHRDQCLAIDTIGTKAVVLIARNLSKLDPLAAELQVS